MSNLGSTMMHKGALISGPIIIPFQYTPEKLTRTLSAYGVSSESTGTEVMRIKGPPQETIAMSVLLDATDQMERGQGLTTKLGIYPSLSAIELLLYPDPVEIVANAALTALGIIEVIPPLIVPTILVWGVSRVVPVQVNSMTITEEMFDNNLVPIRANLELTFRVLTYSDLGLLSVGGMLSMANHVEKVALAAKGAVSTYTGNSGS